VKAPVERLCPAARVPTAFIGGQSVWIGCGSDCISWNVVSSFTNVTVPPTAIVTDFGLTPADVMVTVALEGEGGGVGIGVCVGVGCGSGVGVGTGVGVGVGVGCGAGADAVGLEGEESLPPQAPRVRSPAAARPTRLARRLPLAVWTRKKRWTT
jgi:hypothetical protein